MTHCHNGRALLLLAALAGAGCGAETPEETGAAPPPPALPGGPPNLLLITVDTLRADRLGSYGYAGSNSPNIDALAARGTLFEQASTVIPRTSQSLASMFTSLYPHEHGALEIAGRMGPQAVTLAEILAARGYATMAVSANAVAGPDEGLDQGFTEFVTSLDLGQRYPRLWRDFREPPVEPFTGWAEAVSVEALVWLLDEQRESPWFLWLLYFDPHWLYNPPPPYNAVVDWSTFRFYREFGGFQPPSATVYYNLNGRAAEVQPEASRLYDAEVRYTDQMIGQLLSGLLTRPDASNTLIVFTADHGESLGEHGYFYEHGDFVYEASMRVPLVFYWPGQVPGGTRSNIPVSTLDILPTVLGLMRVPPPPDVTMSGRDLGPMLRGDRGRIDELRRRVIFGESGSALMPQNPYRAIGGTFGRKSLTAEYVRHENWVAERRGDSPRVLLYDAGQDPGLLADVAAKHADVLQGMTARLDDASVFGGRWRMARDGRWKLIRIPTTDGIRWELYDLVNDPAERIDVSSSRPAVVERLRAELEGWIATIPLQAGGTGEPGEEDEATRERLRSLGYVE